MNQIESPISDIERILREYVAFVEMLEETQAEIVQRIEEVIREREMKLEL